MLLSVWYWLHAATAGKQPEAPPPLPPPESTDPLYSADISYPSTLKEIT